MDLNYNLLNILILFGAIQGFILCIFLYQKRKANIKAISFFLLFLFSLAFFNLIYALLNMEVFKYYRPLHMFPFPYKWLMGTGVYFYVKNQFESEGNRSYLKKEWWLFAPAILYGLLRTYWFAIAVSENSFRITGVVINSGFFRIHEIFYLVFGIVLGIASLQFIKKNMGNYLIQGKQLKVLKWLQLFTWVFLIKTCVDLTIYIIDLSIHGGQESFLLYYPILLLNSAFIYWIGYIGFTKPTIFFSKFKLRSKQQLSEKDIRLQHQLKYFMEESEVFTNPNLKLNELSIQLECTPKELSSIINIMGYSNFSEYLIQYRIEKVKKLLSSSEAEKYTLISLAQTAGFSSKSSFNASFKKITGMTPSAFKKKKPL